MQDAIQKLSAIHDELVRSILSETAPSQASAGLGMIKNAAAYLRNGNTRATLKYRDLREAMRAVRAALKQKTVTAAPGIRDVGEFYYHRRFAVDLVQNYLALSVVDRRETIVERQIDAINGPLPSAITVDEEAGKPVVEPVLKLAGGYFQKHAFTSVITEEAILSNPALLDFWVFYAANRLEYQLHLFLLNVLFGNASAITVTSQGIPYPRIIDLIYYLKQLYNYRAPQGVDFEGQAVAAVIPEGYWLTLGIQQDNTGAARDLSVISDIAIIPRSGANNTYSLVFGREDLVVYVLNDVNIYLERVVDQADDRNLFRFTAELHSAAVPRIGLSVRVNDTSASIAALQ